MKSCWIIIFPFKSFISFNGLSDLFKSVLLYMLQTITSWFFIGIPLKDELHAPISFMRDIGKEFVPPPLPALPKDFKEYPERDLVCI